MRRLLPSLWSFFLGVVVGILFLGASVPVPMVW